MQYSPSQGKNVKQPTKKHTPPKRPIQQKPVLPTHQVKSTISKKSRTPPANIRPKENNSSIKNKQSNEILQTPPRFTEEAEQQWKELEVLFGKTIEDSLHHLCLNIVEAFRREGEISMRNEIKSSFMKAFQQIRVIHESKEYGMILELQKLKAEIAFLTEELNNRTLEAKASSFPNTATARIQFLESMLQESNSNREHNEQKYLQEMGKLQSRNQECEMSLLEQREHYELLLKQANINFYREKEKFELEQKNNSLLFRRQLDAVRDECEERLQQKETMIQELEDELNHARSIILSSGSKDSQIRDLKARIEDLEYCVQNFEKGKSSDSIESLIRATSSQNNVNLKLQSRVTELELERESYLNQLKSLQKQYNNTLSLYERKVKSLQQSNEFVKIENL